MNPPRLFSVREDESSIFYTHRNGKTAVTLTVLKVDRDFIGCDVTDHVADPGSDLCTVLDMPGTCRGHSLAFARGLYAALQQNGKAERVDDERVFGALASYMHTEIGA
jgi:hypothetical protein